MAVRHQLSFDQFFWRSIRFAIGSRVRGEITSNVGQSYFFIRSWVGRRVYQYRWNGRQGSRKRNREPFWHLVADIVAPIVFSMFAYPLFRSSSSSWPTFPRCFYPSIRRARVISSFLYPFSLPCSPNLDSYSTRFLKVFSNKPSSSKNIPNGSSSLSLSLSKEIAGRF